MTHYHADSSHDEDSGRGTTRRAPTESSRGGKLKQEIERLKEELKDTKDRYWDIHTRNTQLEADNRRLISTNDTLSARLETLDSLIPMISKIYRLVVDLPSLVQLVQRHEDDFREWKTDATRQRDDIGSEQHRSVGDVWQEFDDLYKQQVRGLANTLSGQLETDPDEPRRPKAKLVHDMMAVLFPASPAESHRPADLETLFGRLNLTVDHDQQRVAEELTNAATAIRAEAAALGVIYFWTADAAWVATHPDQADFWTDCDEADPPVFVVRPAFTIKDKVIGTTTLFSSQRPEQSG